MTGGANDVHVSLRPDRADGTLITIYRGRLHVFFPGVRPSSLHGIATLSPSTYQHQLRVDAGYASKRKQEINETQMQAETPT